MTQLKKTINKKIDKDDLSVTTEYLFSSGIGPVEENRYIKAVQATVYNGGYSDNTQNEIVGTINFKILYLDQAIDDGFDILQIFDAYEYTFRHGQKCFDFRKSDFKNAVYAHYDNIIVNSNICIIETISLIPAFRGFGLAPKLFKDLVLHFKRDASLFVLQPYPLQFDVSIMESEKNGELGLESFEKNKTRAMRGLSNYYESWGFEKIKGIKELMFFNAELINPRFDEIDIDE